MADLSQTLEPIFVGEDVDLVFTTDDAGDFSAWAVSFVATVQSEAGAAISKTTAAATVTLSNAARTMTVAIRAADTTSRSPTIFSFLLRRTDSGSNRVLAAGLLPLK